MDPWAQIVIPLVTLAGGWFGNSWRFRRERQDKLAELRQKSDELENARQQAEQENEARREVSDRDWIEKAAQLCRSDNPQDRQHGRSFLIGLAAMGNTDPRVEELLEQVTQLELGHTVAEIREAKEHGDSVVDIVEEVVVSDAFDIGGDEGEGGQAAGGSVQTQEARQDQDDQGDAPASGGSSRATDR